MSILIQILIAAVGSSKCGMQTSVPSKSSQATVDTNAMAVTTLDHRCGMDGVLVMIAIAVVVVVVAVVKIWLWLCLIPLVLLSGRVSVRVRTGCLVSSLAKKIPAPTIAINARGITTAGQELCM